MRKLFCFLLALVAVTANAATKEQEKNRGALVDAELAKYEHRILTYDASSLQPRDKEFLRKLLVAATLVEEINMLEINPANLEYMAEVARTGSANDKMLFHRNQGPWCLESDDHLCSALASIPPKKIGWGGTRSMGRNPLWRSRSSGTRSPKTVNC